MRLAGTAPSLIDRAYAVTGSSLLPALATTTFQEVLERVLRYRRAGPDAAAR
jgi:hypothetical protein